MKFVFEENKIDETSEMDIKKWVEKNAAFMHPYIDYDLNVISGRIVKIKTEDTYLPYQILSTDELIITAPNLKTCENFPIHGLNDITFSIEFNSTNNLDVSELHIYSDSGLKTLKFVKMPSLNPQSLKNLPIASLVFTMTNSPHILDINNYVHLHVDKIILEESRIHAFKNMSTFFDNLLEINSFAIDLDFLRNNAENKMCEKLNSVLIKYFNVKSKRIDYSMDAILELIEAGFEDML